MPTTIFHDITDNTDRSQFKAVYAGDDSIDGTGGADRIRGWAGRDTILGEGGNDEIRGDGVGLPYDPDLPDTDPVNFADSILAGAGNDSVWGGGGNDTLLGEDGSDRLYGQGGGDSIDGGRGVDEINGGENNDTCRGGADNDWIAGGPGLDSLYGDDGNDKIYAFAPDSEASRWGWIDDGTGDQISGGNGNDTLIGGKGIDTLTGGAGRDSMSGSSGDDIFRYGAASETGNSLTTCDVITDFAPGHDKIDLHDFDASTAVPGENAFVWRGSRPFTTSAEGELRYQKYDNPGTANDYTVIFGDTDSDTASEFQIKLQGLVTLTQADFILGPVGAKVVFSANDGTHGRELWRSDGTDAGTVLVKDINPGGDSYPSGLTNVNGTLFFIADDGTSGYELWKSDGTAAGTVLVKDINPGSGGIDPGDLANVNGTLFFGANDGTSGSELWKSDGTAAGTVLVKDINPGGYSSIYWWQNPPTDVNGTLFFQADDGTGGQELWKSDGTAAGTVLVKDINPGGGGSGPGGLTNVNGTLFFSADNGTGGWELWKSNGTAAGTVLVKDINPGGGGSDLGNLTNVNGTLFFTADDGTSGSELWKSNGTAAGTVLVKDINPGGNGSAPSSLTNFKGALFFNANDGTNGGGDLWKSDGTAAGTVLVKDIDAVDPLRPDWDGWIGALTSVNGVLFFSRTQRDVGRLEEVLWKSDGTEAGTVPVTGKFGNALDGLNNANGTLIFSAGEQVVAPHSGGGLGMDLWKSDGTEAGTVMVKDIWPGQYYYEAPNPAGITPFDFVLV
ncbi:MAG: M10 family metallopeptidase C-terminal domain-containing protein [Defluviicoccus sp.]|nr:M10 family metallopeptidase C-terminal domain-containing protein [Defluviicoccus sp.]MDG4610250.1 M10 family metallopeptidase C-terminal domain-containing protein [Defluviicoccus sp.]